MSIGSNSLSGAIPKPERVGDFVEMLSLMADPDKFQAQVKRLREATEETAIRTNFLLPKKEIEKEYDRAVQAAEAREAAAQANLKKLEDVFASAKTLVEDVANSAKERAQAIVTAAREVHDEAVRIRTEAEEERAERSAALSTLINDFIAKGASITKSQAQAEAIAEEAKDAKAQAEAAEKDFRDRIAKIMEVAKGA